MNEHTLRLHCGGSADHDMPVTGRTHLAVISPNHARAILSGDKTIESRLSVTRRVPFGQVGTGERVYFLARRIGLVVTAVVRCVESHSTMMPELIDELRRKHGPAIGADDRYWVEKRMARYATLIWLERAERAWYAPDDVHGRERSYRSAWFVRPGEQCVYPACCQRLQRHSG